MVKDGIVIDVSDMKKVQLIKEKEVAIVLTGTHIGPLVKKLAQKGLHGPLRR